MKILMITMIMQIGGAETHIAELCRALRRMGHSVTLASAGGVYADSLAQYGVRHITLPLNSKKPSAVLKSYRGLKKLLKNEYFDVVHSHARIPSFILELLRSQYDFRFVTTAHLNFKVNFLWKKLSFWGERTIAVSEDIKTYLYDNYKTPPENVSVTINGIDSEKFSPGTDYSSIIDEFSLSQKSKRIVYVSRLDPDRSLPAFQLIEIADRLAERFKNIEICIVGSGGDYEKLSELAREANENIGRRTVIMCGGRTDINKFAAASDVFVAVSRAALEAMSAAKSVILAGNQGYMGIFSEDMLPLAVENNFCCRGFEMSSGENLLRDITALLSEDEETRRIRGEANREIVKRFYSAERMANDYLDVYHSLPSENFRWGDIVVSGYYGFGNLGDDSLLDAITDSLCGELFSPRITALTRKGIKRQKSDKRVKFVSRSNPLAVMRAIRHSKMLLFGGGTLLQDTTSRKSLFYYLAVIKLAAFFKKKIYIYANGIGPLYHKFDRKATLACLKCADIVSVRDPDSKNLLREIGYSGEIHLSADSAYLIKPSGKPDFKLPAGKIAVVSLRECSGKMSREYSSAKLENAVASALAELYASRKVTPIFIPMQPSRDEAICRRVMEMTNIPDSAVYCVKDEDELDSVLSSENVCFALGMRLHMLIFASRAALPSIALSYDVKVDSLMRTLNQTTLLHVQSTTKDDLLREFNHVLDFEENIRREMKASAEKLSSLAKSDVIRAHELLKK